MSPPSITALQARAESAALRAAIEADRVVTLSRRMARHTPADDAHYLRGICHRWDAAALRYWRRRRDAECAVSRMLDDGRPRFERRFGNSTWTVGGAS